MRLTQQGIRSYSSRATGGGESADRLFFSMLCKDGKVKELDHIGGMCRVQFERYPIVELEIVPEGGRSF